MKEYLRALDGLRGIGALTVFTCHLINGVLGRHGYQSDYYSYLAQFAVYVFFIITGFAISLGHFQGGEAKTLGFNILSRYLRLSFLIGISAVAGYILVHMGLTYNREFKSWAFPYFGKAPTLWDVMRASFYHVYAHGGDFLNPALWTMQIELFGSVALYCVLSGCRRAPTWLMYGAFLVFCYYMPARTQFYFLCFPYGMLLAQIYATWPGRRTRVVSLGSGAIALVILIYINILSEFSLLHGVRVFLAGVTVFCLMANGTFQRFCDTPGMRFLGDISISLFILHFAVIASFTCYLYIQMQRAGFSPGVVFSVTLVASYVVMIGVSYCAVPLERATHHYSKKISHWLLGLGAVAYGAVKR